MNREPVAVLFHLAEGTVLHNFDRGDLKTCVLHGYAVRVLLPNDPALEITLGDNRGGANTMIPARCLSPTHPEVQPLVVILVALHDGGTKEYGVRGREAVEGLRT